MTFFANYNVILKSIHFNFIFSWLSFILYLIHVSIWNNRSYKQTSNRNTTHGKKNIFIKSSINNLITHTLESVFAFHKQSLK